MTNETTAPVQSLHDQIMRLPCTPPKDANVNQSISYKSGHRDARHAAAELAAEHEAEQQQELTAIEAMARMLADGEWAEHVGELGGPIAQRLETEITRMHNERHEVYQEACAAVPDVRAMVDRFLGWKLPDDFSPDAGISFSKPSNPAWWPTGTNLLSADQAKALFEHVLAVAQAIPAKPTQADMNAAIDRMRRENNLSIDGDNAYKRDLLDCVIGALAFGKQGSTPPPEDYWLHRFWEIGDAERKERDAAPTAQQSPDDGRRDGIEAVAKMIEKQASDYAMEFGNDDLGALSFGAGSRAEAKHDHYSTLCELAEEVRAMLAAPGDTAAPEQAEQDAVKLPRELLADLISPDHDTRIQAERKLYVVLGGDA